MIWQYYIPHSWSRGTKVFWEDVYIRPHPEQEGLESWSKNSLWLTIDTLGEMVPDDVPGAAEDNADYKTRLAELAGREYAYDPQDDTNMLVNKKDMTHKEFMGFVKTWINDQLGDACPTLKKGKKKDFDGSNQHACAVQKAAAIAKQYKSSKVKIVQE